MKNSELHYGGLHIAMHWLVALVVVGLFVLGLWMRGLDYYSSWYHKAPLIHQSVGVLLVLVMVFRLFWRRIAGMPAPIATHKPWEKVLAGIVHAALYLLIISMMFSGYFIATADGQPLGFFAWGIPATITNVEYLEDFAAAIHENVAYAIIGIAGLHGLAALKHHLVDKDASLKRMLPFLNKQEPNQG